MRSPSRPLVLVLLLVLALPFASGCFTVQPSPLPEPPEREATEIRGVVVAAQDDGEQEVEFDEVVSVDWGAEGVEISGFLEGESLAPPRLVTRHFAYEDLAGVLTRQLDVNRTSFLVAGVALAAVASIVFFYTPRTGGVTTVR